jgi:putative DNA primase/helicase
LRQKVKGAKAREIASARTGAAVERLAKTDRRLAATKDQWDADPWLLNTPGGVVDLHTGQMRAHRPEDYMTKQTAVSPGGDCPQWKKFMSEVTAGDVELQSYLQRGSGYCLTGVTHEQELFFNYGTGQNGKGTFTRAISGILNDYHTNTSIETFTVSKNERHPTELAKLVGARLVTATETEEGRSWSQVRITEMTGGDQIDARFMRQDFFTFYPQFKLWFSGNHMPTLRTVNKAIARRFNRIPFKVTIPAGAGAVAGAARSSCAPAGLRSRPRPRAAGGAMDGSESLEMRLSDEIWAEIEDAAWALPLRHREKYRRAVERELAEVD